MPPARPLTDDELAAAARAAVRALPDAPAAWIERAITLFPVQPSPLAQAAGSALRLLQAVLSFDSWAQPALAAGMRSAAAVHTRHLLFSVEGRDIDLRVSPEGEAFTLAGQVLGPDETGTVTLTAADGARREAALDDLGEFRVEGLSRGRYAVTLRLAADEVALPPLDVGPRP